MKSIDNLLLLIFSKILEKRKYEKKDLIFSKATWGKKKKKKKKKNVKKKFLLKNHFFDFFWKLFLFHV